MNSSEDIFDTYKKEMQEATTPSEQIGVDKERLWQRVSEQLNEQPAQALPKQRKLVPWSIAAVLVMGLGIAYWFKYVQSAPIITTPDPTIAQSVSPQKPIVENELKPNLEEAGKSTVMPPQTSTIATAKTRKPQLIAANETSKTKQKSVVAEELVMDKHSDEKQKASAIINSEQSSVAMHKTSRKEASKELTNNQFNQAIQLDTVVLQRDFSFTEDETIARYGSVTKSRWVGDGDRVSSDKVDKLPTTNVAQAIEGNAPSVQISGPSGQPGSGSAIRIRGLSSVDANAEPLIIVDGAVFSGKLSDIKQEDIATIDVLNDALSTSLYGSRAARGVISVQTKESLSKAEKKAARAKKKADRKAKRKQP